MLSRFVIAFLPRNKLLLISWWQSPSTVILKPKKIKSVTSPNCPPSISYEVTGPDTLILVFWMLSFKPVFSLFSFTFFKRLFGSFSLFAISAVSAYMRLLIVLEVLILSCNSSSSTFYMMYSVYKSNKQYTALSYSFAKFEPVSCSMPRSNCHFLTCIQVS